MAPLLNWIADALNNWQAVIPLAPVASVWVLYYQTKQQRKFEAFWNLYRQWGSPEMRATRRRAATLLEQKEYLKNPALLTVDISDVLDFFDTLAMLARKSIVDKNLAWHQFYWWAVNYWYASEEYVRQVQAAEGEKTWEDIKSFLPQLMKREGQNQRPDAAQLAKFLDEEKGLP